MKKSKRLFAIVLALVMISVSSVYASAESEEYGAFVSIPQVIYYDSSENPGNNNILSFTVSVRNIEKYEYGRIYIDFNKNVLEVDMLVCPTDLIYESYEETDTGVYFETSFPDKYLDRNDPAFKNSTGSAMFSFYVKGEGTPDINIYAYAINLDGTRKDLTVDYTIPYNRIVNIRDIEFVELDKEYAPYYYGIFNGEIAVKDILSKIDAESAVIKNPDGEILSDNDLVPTKSRIVTLYKGYEVNSVPLCIKYDVDCDGKVTAADARLTLRRAAEMENLEMWQSADIDGNRKITAADARSILRKAANLE